MSVEFKFVPVQEFEWWRDYDDGEKRLVGHYVPGNTYNCTREPRHDMLREKCKEWEAEGKIKKIPLAPGQFFTTVKTGEN